MMLQDAHETHTYHRQIPRLRLLWIVIVLAAVGAFFTMCPSAEARPREGAVQVAALTAEVNGLRASVDRLVRLQETQQTRMDLFWQKRPLFAEDIDVLRAQVSRENRERDARITALEIWRWGLGGAFIVLCGVVGFILKAYRAEIKIEKDV